MNSIECKNLSKSFYVEDNRIDVLNNVNLSINEADLVAISGESGAGKSFKEVLEEMPKTSKDFAILIGPEGGFSVDEQKMLAGKKFTYPASMGKRILRAETAALAALGAFQAIRGDWR